MAESTAGIGEAGALVNRAKAPATLDITRGLQMAESSALKKAQLEAAKEAKKQAKADAIARASKVDIGKFKNLGVSKEGEKIANDLYTELSLALETGSYEAEAKAKSKIPYLRDYLASKDNAITTLKSPKKYEYAKKAGELINAGKEEEAVKLGKAYAPIFVKGEMGDYNVEVPDAVDLNKVYSSVLKNALKDQISFASLKDAATDTDNYAIKRRMTPEEVAMTSGELLRDAGYRKSVLYNPDFQKFYDAKYGGSGDSSSQEIGLYDYTQERINNLNKDKSTIKGKSKTGSNNYELTGDGYNLGKYSFTILNVSPSELVEKFNIGKDETMYGTNRSTSKIFMEGLSKQLASNGIKVSMPANETKTFILDDPKVGNSIEGIPLSIYAAGNTKSGFLIYKDKNTDINQIVPLNSELVARLASYYKVNSQEFINANKRKGVDLTKYTPDGSVNIKKDGGSTPRPAKAAGGTKKVKINLGAG